MYPFTIQRKKTHKDCEIVLKNVKRKLVQGLNLHLPILQSSDAIITIEYPKGKCNIERNKQAFEINPYQRVPIRPFFEE